MFTNTTDTASLVFESEGDASLSFIEFVNIGIAAVPNLLTMFYIADQQGVLNVFHRIGSAFYNMWQSLPAIPSFPGAEASQVPSSHKNPSHVQNYMDTLQRNTQEAISSNNLPNIFKPYKKAITSTLGHKARQVSQEQVYELYGNIYKAVRAGLVEAKSSGKKLALLIGECHVSQKDLILETLLSIAVKKLDPTAQFFVEEQPSVLAVQLRSRNIGLCYEDNASLYNNIFGLVDFLKHNLDITPKALKLDHETESIDANIHQIDKNFAKELKGLTRNAVFITGRAHQIAMLQQDYKHLLLFPIATFASVNKEDYINDSTAFAINQKCLTSTTPPTYEQLNAEHCKYKVIPPRNINFREIALRTRQSIMPHLTDSLKSERLRNALPQVTYVNIKGKIERDPQTKKENNALLYPANIHRYIYNEEAKYVNKIKKTEQERVLY